MDHFNLAKNTQLHTETQQALHKTTFLSLFYIHAAWWWSGAVVRAVALQQEEGCGFKPRALSVWTLHAYILSEWVLFTSTHNPKT